MAIFDPIRDYFHRRQAKTLNEQAHRVHLVNRRQESPWGNFVFPGTDYFDDIEVDGEHVGSIEYGVSPLLDRVYISDFEIFTENHRRGFAQAALWRLWLQYQMPLTPMHEVGTSLGFWAKVRERFAAAGVVLTEDIRTAHQEGEKQRWQHLVPEPEHKRLQRELMASDEWPAIKARWEAEYGPCLKD
jgi:hypothetical protein